MSKVWEARQCTLLLLMLAGSRVLPRQSADWAQARWLALFLATVIELFHDDRTEAEYKELDGSVPGTAKTKQIEYLAQARQTFAVSAMIAWKQISDFRTSWSMRVLDSPGH
jgi:hypothetical protein